MKNIPLDNQFIHQLSPSTKASNPFANKDLATLTSPNVIEKPKKKKNLSLRDLKQILKEERVLENTSNETTNDKSSIDHLMNRKTNFVTQTSSSGSPRKSLSTNTIAQEKSPLSPLKPMSPSYNSFSRSQILESPVNGSGFLKNPSLSPIETSNSKAPKRFVSSVQTKLNSAPNTPTSKEIGDPFVEEIVAIERDLKLRNSKNKRNSTSNLGTPKTPRTPSKTPATPTTPTTNSRNQLFEDAKTPSTPVDTEDQLSPNDIFNTTLSKKPILFDTVESQQPLKLQYDPRQIRFGTNDASDKPLKDLIIMADACNRAGRHRMEALAHYKIATLYEEHQKPVKAINHYRKFLHICQGLKDDIGISLALNRLGVVFQTLGGDENYKTALEYHIRHWEIADTQSRIVAHINMGLIFQYGTKDFENAGEHYRMAFQYALEIGDKQGESIALSTLGSLGKESGDLLTAQACIERHLTLSESMKDGKSTTDAYHQLGQLANERGNTENAVKMLSKARQIATINNDQTKANQIKCSIGIIEGNAKFEAYLKNLSESITTHASNIIIPPSFNSQIEDIEYEENNDEETSPTF